MVCNSKEEVTVKPFRFLNFWIKHHQFKEIVSQNWKIDFSGSPFVEFHAKMKKVKSALVRWSEEVFGNIFHHIATIEDIIRVKETQIELQPSASNRAELNRTEADLKKYYKIEEDFWRQKVGMKWFSEGDKNTKFFHSYVKGRRRKLHISEIEITSGQTVQTVQQIGEAAVSHFAEQFQEEDYDRDVDMLNHIPNIITEVENEEMSRLPDLDEVKEIIFALNANSACGPD